MNNVINDYNPLPYKGPNPLPTYANLGKVEHTLYGQISGGYIITLAKLTVADSMSAGTPLTHALFESYTDHGEPCAVARTRTSGYDREFMAVKNAMFAVGIDFNPSPTCDSEKILQSLGDWFKFKNPEIIEVSVVSQTCH